MAVKRNEGIGSVHKGIPAPQINHDNWICGDEAVSAVLRRFRRAIHCLVLPLPKNLRHFGPVDSIKSSIEGQHHCTPQIGHVSVFGDGDSDNHGLARRPRDRLSRCDSHGNKIGRAHV